MRRVAPRAEYTRTRDWIWDTVKARLRLPWLSNRLGFIRTALLVTVTSSTAFAALVAGALSEFTDVSFWLAFLLAFAIASGWWVRRWLWFWRLVARGRPRPWGHSPGDYGVREPRRPLGPRPSPSVDVDPDDRPDPASPTE